MAPVILPRPPKISTARPLNPMITPIVGSIALKDKPTNTPAAAPSAEAIITVTEIIIVGLIPRSAAVSVLIDTARIALPILVLIIAFCVRINNSRVGRAFAAIKADDHAAELMGINVVYYKMMAFIIGAFIAGIGGGLYAHITNFINPTDFSYHKVVQILLFPVFGGSNVVWGSVLGSFILTLLPEVLRFLSDYRDIIYGALLVILMAVRPDGILTESMVDKISRKLGFKKAPYIPETQVLTERFEAYKRKQQDKQG